MEARLPPEWTTAEVFEERPSPGAFGRLDAVVRDAGIDARRWQSTSGERALLIPADAVTDLAAGPLSITGRTEATAGPAALLFVDPVTDQALGPLLAAIGPQALDVRVALPEHGVSEIPGLAAEDGRVTLAAGTAPAGWRLYRPVPAQGPWSAAGPEADAGVLSRRERWFGSRHGGGR